MQPMADAGAVRQFVRFTQTSGLALSDSLDDELSAAVRAATNQERVGSHIIVDLLQVCATIWKQPDLGVAFAAWANLRGYGPLSILWDHCSSLSDAIRVNQRYLHLESAALATVCEEFGDLTYLSSVMLIEPRFGSSQFMEATTALSVQVGRLILGPQWSPVRIEFQHAAPPVLQRHRAFFRCPIEFGAERNAVVIETEDVRRRTGVGNAHMLAYLERHLQSDSNAWPQNIEQQVERVIAVNLTRYDISLTSVAKALRINVRTLQRRLDACGLSYNRIVETVRKRVVQEYLRDNESPTLSELTFRLGYKEVTTASRFLSTKVGVRLRDNKPAAR